MKLVPALDFSAPGWTPAVKRLGDLFVVYGHGLLAFGVGKAFTGALDGAAVLAVAMGLACHVSAFYIAYRLERRDGR